MWCWGMILISWQNYLYFVNLIKNIIQNSIFFSHMEVNNIWTHQIECEVVVTKFIGLFLLLHHHHHLNLFFLIHIFFHSSTSSWQPFTRTGALASPKKNVLKNILSIIFPFRVPWFLQKKSSSSLYTSN